MTEEQAARLAIVTVGVIAIPAIWSLLVRKRNQETGRNVPEALGYWCGKVWARCKNMSGTLSK